VSNFKQDRFAVPFELVNEFNIAGKLSDTHGNDLDKILQKELKLHDTIVLEKIIGERLRLATAKKMNTPENVETMILTIKNIIRVFNANLSYIISCKNKICFREMKTDELLLQYIKEIILYGSLTLLCMMNKDDTIQYVFIQLLIEQLKKFTEEKLSFDAKEIASRIEARNEKERSNIIKKFDKMSDEEKKIELMKKKLGLGDWAVGGTKLIYAYDKDYYDLEREKRIEAGIVDFPGLEGKQDAPSNVFDILEMGAGEEEGYDPAERNDEDE
jgi:hypothetical protein